MTVYRVIDGKMHYGEVPDGAVCMEIDPGPGHDAIVSICNGDKTYRRRGWTHMRPWPASTYRNSDVTWKTTWPVS